MTSEIGEFINEWIIVNNRCTDNGEAVVKEYLDTNKVSAKG